MELIFIGWMFGIDKLDILLERRTGENIPKVVKYICMYFIPVFTFLMMILNLSNEFSEEKAKARNWNWIITFLGRMLFVIPILIGLFLGSIKRYPATISVYTLIEEQYGIEFNCKGYFDHTFTEKKSLKNDQPTQVELAAPTETNISDVK